MFPFEKYRAALAADKAWSEELHRIFRNRAGDVRYTGKGKGNPGSKLRELHDAKIEADRKLFEEKNP